MYSVQRGTQGQGLSSGSRKQTTDHKHREVTTIRQTSSTPRASGCTEAKSVLRPSLTWKSVGINSCSSKHRVVKMKLCGVSLASPVRSQSPPLSIWAKIQSFEMQKSVKSTLHFVNVASLSFREAILAMIHPHISRGTSHMQSLSHREFSFTTSQVTFFTPLKSVKIPLSFHKRFLEELTRNNANLRQLNRYTRRSADGTRNIVHSNCTWQVIMRTSRFHCRNPLRFHAEHALRNQV